MRHTEPGVALPRLTEGVGFLARVLSTRSTLLYHHLTAQNDITPGQFAALLVLLQRGPLTLTDLAYELRVDRSTLSDMARRLVANGLLDRSPNPDDGRSARISASADVPAIVSRLLPGVSSLQSELLSPLSPGRRRDFLDALQAVAGVEASHCPR